MGFWSNLMGTSETMFRIGKSKATLDASAITAARTHTLPDSSGVIALTNGFARYCVFNLSSGAPSNIPLLTVGANYHIPFTLAGGATSNIPTAVT